MALILQGEIGSSCCMGRLVVLTLQGEMGGSCCMGGDWWLSYCKGRLVVHAALGDWWLSYGKGRLVVHAAPPGRLVAPLLQGEIGGSCCIRRLVALILQGEIGGLCCKGRLVVHATWGDWWLMLHGKIGGSCCTPGEIGGSHAAREDWWLSCCKERLVVAYFSWHSYVSFTTFTRLS